MTPAHHLCSSGFGSQRLALTATEFNVTKGRKSPILSAPATSEERYSKPASHSCTDTVERRRASLSLSRGWIGAFKQRCIVFTAALFQRNYDKGTKLR